MDVVEMNLLPSQQAPPPEYLEPVGIGLDW